MGPDFETYVRESSASLLRTAFLLVGDQASAEDVLQTALLRAYRSWDRIDEPKATDAYVRRIVVRTALNWRFRYRKAQEVLTSVPVVVDEAAPDASTGAVDERLWVWPHLNALPAKQRAVLVLRYYEDLTETQTASVLGCTVGTVKSHHSRALRTLRQKVSGQTRPAQSNPTQKGLTR